MLQSSRAEEGFMSSLPVEVFEMIGQAIVNVAPITIVLALTFSLLTHFWACNPGKPWWRKRDLLTDLCYWFFIPLFARYVRIGLLVMGAAFLFNIHTADGLIEFYEDGHGPLSQLPLWLQATMPLLLLAVGVWIWLRPDE